MKKIHVLLVSSDPGYFAELSQALAEYEQIQVVSIDSSEQAMLSVKDKMVEVIVAAEEIKEGSGLTFIRELVKKNPFINCALVSPLYPHEFHESTEGLGIFMQLPPHPGASQAQKLVEHLARIC